MDESLEKLESWQSIAAYLAVSIRTAQKWERERALPVTRAPGAKGKVTAVRAELDRWRATALNQPNWWDRPRFLRIYLAVTMSLVVLLLGLVGVRWFKNGRKGPPARVIQEFDSIRVTDERGHQLWRVQFDEPIQFEEDLRRMPLDRRATFADLDGDGHLETYYVYAPASPVEKGSTLICYSDRGRENWRFTPGRKVSTASTDFEMPYSTTSLEVLPAARREDARILVVSHHLTDFPTQVALLDNQGRLRGEYWHSGLLSTAEAVDLNGDGIADVLLGGVSRAHQQATLVVLDSLHVGGASVESGTPEFQISGFGPGQEKLRVLFPRSCINRMLEDHNVVEEIMLRPDSIQVLVRERIAEDVVRANPGLIYTLDRNFHFLTVAPTDVFTSLHSQIEAQGRLDHTLTDKEMRDLLPQIRVLTPWKGGK